MNSLWRKQCGLGGLDALIATGIIAIVALVIMRGLSGSLEVSQKMEETTAEDEARGFIIHSISCANTMDPPGPPPPQCVAAGPIRVFDQGGQAMLEPGGTTLPNRIRVRASCAPGLMGMTFESLRVDANNSPALDPITKQPAAWSPLFAQGLSPCTGRLTAAQTDPEEVIAYGDLNQDPVFTLSFIIWAANGGIGPVNVCADSDPIAWPTDTWIPYDGVARCPAGYTAVSGGVDCSASTGPNPLLTTALSTSPIFTRRKGWKTTSSRMTRRELPLYMQPLQPTDDNLQYWYGGCCFGVLAVPLVLNTQGRVWARCVKNV